jgi:hypothetical protein
VYEEQLSTVTASILDEYNTNRPELSVPIRFALTAADLENLNGERPVMLNILERGMIPAYEENVRIVNFKIHSMKAHTEGDQSSFAYFDLLFEHSGLSKMRKNGEIYWFNHVTTQTTNPITWGIRYDALNGMTNAKEPSFASQSLLYSLLGNLDKEDDIMIYSRPGAWADIRISKNNVTSGNTQMVIDTLILELQYDFSQRPTQNRNLDVYTADVDGNLTLTPYIDVSRTDKNGRANGRSVMYRTYNRDSQVALTAPAEYGRYRFVNWTNRYNEVLSNNLQVNVTMSNDMAVTANYKATTSTTSIPPNAVDTQTVEKLQIYPNPTTGEVVINGLQYGEEVQVYDMQGALVRTWRAASFQNAITLNLSALPVGTYIIKAGNKAGKVVKQ